jgi:hypothetical protein
LTDYVPQTWNDGSGGGTPITAARLTFMETGIDTAHSELTTHEALAATAHGAVSTATADTLMRRDANGRTAVATPSAAGDVATKGYVDGNPVAAFKNINVQAFTASGTWTKPAGAALVFVQVVGGGGAGGGVLANTGIGASGGGGGYAQKMMPATDCNATEAVTIGAGATGGSGIGATGGTTTFDTIPGSVSATGGAGGDVNLGSITVARHANGGLGGNGASGDINIEGETGGDGMVTADWWIVGAGGRSGNGWGSGNKFATVGVNATGSDAIGYGGGGNGAGAVSSATLNGGNGSAGIVVVTTYGVL